MKKLFKIIAIVIGVLALVFAALLAYSWYSLNKSKTRFMPAAERAAQALASYDCGRIQPLIDDTIADSFKTQCSTLFENSTRNIVTIQNMQSPELLGTNTNADLDTGITRTASFMVPVEYDGKDGSLLFTLNVKNDPPTIIGFTFRYTIDGSQVATPDPTASP